MTDRELNGWTEGGHYVLKTLDKVEDKINCVERKRNSCELRCNEEITKLKVKAAVGGSIGGLVVSLVATFVVSLGVHLTKDKILDKDTVSKKELVEILEERYTNEEIEKLIEDSKK